MFVRGISEGDDRSIALLSSQGLKKLKLLHAGLNFHRLLSHKILIYKDFVAFTVSPH